MQAQTIAQARAQDPESLWHFLMELPTTMEAQLFYALMAAGVVGMMANYAVKWARSEIGGDLIDYLFVQNKRSTALSFFTYVGISLAAIYGKAFIVTEADVFVGWGMVLWLGLLNGFGIDAIVNKGQRPVWTAEQRAVKADK